jgi:dTDP-4-amino-4,6-dideoxygalactose transaminase
MSGYLVFGKPTVTDADMEEVADTLRSGWIGTGPKVERFERDLEAYIGVPHVRCVSSCTAALFLIMKCHDIGPGDEVLVPAMTFVASPNAVEHLGARPVLVDSDPHTGLMDLEHAEAAITPRTRAIMPVHLAGRPMPAGAIAELRDRHSLAVIEDAAHAIGSETDGGRVGSHGNHAAFSFYVTKNVTTVEGGAVATHDSELAERIERLALHGLSLGAWQRFSDSGYRHYEVEEPGYKFNMTDIHASLGLHQLARLDESIARREMHWAWYNEALANLPLELPAAPEPGTRHARHLYQVLIGRDARRDRDEVVVALHEQGVGSGVHYRGVHLHPYYRDRYGIEPNALPVATDISRRTLSLPLEPHLQESDLARVASALKTALAM